MSGTDQPDGGGAAPPTFDELSAAFAGNARSMFGAGDVKATVDVVVHAAVEAIEGCDFAGLFLIEDRRVTAPAATGSVAAELDALQQRLDEGPCLDAIAQTGLIYAEDLAAGSPWPAFGRMAVAAGVRCALSVHLLGDGVVGALNCYGSSPLAFGATDRAKAIILATIAGLAISTAEARQASADHAAHLETALGSREVIGQAQGILMERERLSADQAFDILRLASQHLNLKLRDVAQQLVDTGESPSTGQIQPPT